MGQEYWEMMVNLIEEGSISFDNAFDQAKADQDGIGINYQFFS